MFETFKNFLARTSPKRQSLIQYNILDLGGSMVLYGETGVWKSWLAMHLADSISSGRDWLIYPVNDARVGIINTELTTRQYQDRWISYLKYHATTENLFIYSESGKTFGSQLRQLLGWIKNQQLNIIIIDNLYSSLPGDMKGSEAVKDFLAIMDMIRFDCQCAVVLIHHSRQPQTDIQGRVISQQEYEMFGSSYLPNWADTIMEVNKVYVEGLRDTIKVTIHKFRLMDVPPINATYKFNRQILEFEVVI